MLTAIIPTYRNPDYLDLCLKSATENMVKDETEIIVVVDGFVEESNEVLAKYEHAVRVIELPKNMGMQYAINSGVAQANNEYVFVLNDDNVFGTEWDARLDPIIDICDFDGQRSHPNFVLTVNQVEPSPGMFYHRVNDLGQDVDAFRYTEWLEYEKFISDREDQEQLEGRIFPFIVKKKHYMAIGGMDTFYNSPNICDWDMFLKWELLDFWFPRTYKVHLYHFGSVVTKKNSESFEFAQRHQNAMAEYAWKWGANPHNEPKTNSKIPPGRQFRGFTA